MLTAASSEVYETHIVKRIFVRILGESYCLGFFVRVVAGVRGRAHKCKGLVGVLGSYVGGGGDLFVGVDRHHHSYGVLCARLKLV